MGTSTDAIYFYGLIWDQEDFEPWAESLYKDRASELWWDILDRQLGIRDQPYNERLAGRAALGVEIVEHCHSDVMMYGVGIIKSIVTASRGSPEPIKVMDLRLVPPTWNQQILNFCSLMQIDVSTSLSTRRARHAREPKDAYEFHFGWWLCSYWSP